MIIRVMGNNGSGKSTLVRRLLPLLGERADHECEGRRVGYALSRVLLVGRYNDDNLGGGCDNLPGWLRNRDYFFARLEEWSRDFAHVLHEGVVFGDEVPRTVRSSRQTPWTIVYLAVPLEECIESVRARRAALGQDPAFSQKQIIQRQRQMQSVAFRLSDAGVPVRKLSREAAYDYLRETLT